MTGNRPPLLHAHRASAFACGFGTACTLAACLFTGEAFWLLTGAPFVAVNAALAWPDVLTEIRICALHWATRILRRKASPAGRPVPAPDEIGAGATPFPTSQSGDYHG